MLAAELDGRKLRYDEGSGVMLTRRTN